MYIIISQFLHNRHVYLLTTVCEINGCRLRFSITFACTSMIVVAIYSITNMLYIGHCSGVLNIYNTGRPKSHTPFVVSILTGNCLFSVLLAIISVPNIPMLHDNHPYVYVKQDRRRTYNVTQWCVRIMFIPLQLS